MKINWTHPDWAYLLGVLQTKGAIAQRSINIGISYRESEYAELLIDLLKKLNLAPKVHRTRSTMSIQVYDRHLREAVSPFNDNSFWSISETINVSHWLSGIFDTNGKMMKLPKCAILINQGREGNLKLVVDALTAHGIKGTKILNSTSSFNEDTHEFVQLTSYDTILRFAEIVVLRHPQKAFKLQLIGAHIHAQRSKVPLWQQVAIFLSEEPRTWKEVADRFSLSRPQFNSVIEYVKKNCHTEVIPPPEALSKYHVKHPYSIKEK